MKLPGAPARFAVRPRGSPYRRHEMTGTDVVRASDRALGMYQRSIDIPTGRPGYIWDRTLPTCALLAVLDETLEQPFELLKQSICRWGIGLGLARIETQPD